MLPTHYINRLHQWIDCLSNNREEPGLQVNDIIDGRTRRALIYSIVYRYSGNIVFEAKAQQLLDYIIEQIQNEVQVNFGNGIAGIGWAIEWLAQNKFIDGNTDEILSDLDDEIYKSVIYQKSASLSYYSGALGKALYFYTRYQCENPIRSRYRSIANLECLILQIDEINELLFDKEKGMLRDFESAASVLLLEDIENIADSMIFLSRISGLRIYPEITMRIVKGIIAFIEALYTEGQVLLLTGSSDKSLVKGHLKLCYAYYFAGLMFRRSGWLLKGKTLFDRLTVNENEGVFDQPVVAELFSRFYHATGSAAYLSLLENSIDIDQYFDNARFSFTAGAGIFLTLMGIQKPHLPQCNEILLL